MNYQESRAYMEQVNAYGRVLGLENIEELMKRLGNPQDDLKFIHAAGTNGKGSTLAYISTALQEAGYRVGRYTSPAIYSYREIMTVNGENISEEAFARHLTRVAAAAEEMADEGGAHPTPFEIETAVAFLYFQEEGCDLVALETGMGGATDATNVVKNTLLAVLTPVGMDHMGFLGNTLGEIAKVKAGIIKPGCTVVSAAQKTEAAAAIARMCREMGAKLVSPKAGEWQVLASSCMGQRFSWKGTEYEISLAGDCQIENAVLALTALRELEEKGYAVGTEAARRGLRNTRWGGRFSVLDQEPFFVVDGAHNPDAARRLEESVLHYFKGKDIYFIMGMYRDKDYDQVLRRMCPYAKGIYTIATTPRERSLTARELAEAAGKYRQPVQACESLEEAAEKAWEAAGEQDVILAFGSLSFLGRMTEIVEEHKKNKTPKKR